MNPQTKIHASSYLLATPQGYTKHYYAESERVASQIGDGNFANITAFVTDTATANRKLHSANNMVRNLNPNITGATAQFAYLTNSTIFPIYISETYWYHPDHLGSSSWITDTGGRAIQHLHYLPWGENFVDQRANSFDGVRYTFSAKEKDSETGLSYFGSRYYSSDLSIWLSVDPMSDKYPSLSPYTYCANNPVKVVDPNGEDYDVFITGEGGEWATKQLSDTYQNLNITRDKFGRLHTNVEDLSSLTKDEKLIYDAINATDVVVNITVGNGNQISTGVGNFTLDRSSGFAGNILSGDKSMAFTCQLINKSKVIADYYAKDRGKLVAHELTESYIGGKYSLEKQCLAPPAVWVDGQNPYYFNKHYRFAHDNASIQPYNKNEIRNMFCQGFSCSGIAYDLFIEKAIRH